MHELTVDFDALSLGGFFRIFDLPWELFSSVCSYLDDDLIRSIRLVFRAINDRSIGYTSIWIFESSGLVPTARPATHQFRLSFLTSASLSGRILSNRVHRFRVVPN
jgi:hypothetical protein